MKIEDDRKELQIPEHVWKRLGLLLREERMTKVEEFGGEFVESEALTAIGAMKAEYIQCSPDGCTVWSWYKGEWVERPYP